MSGVIDLLYPVGSVKLFGFTYQIGHVSCALIVPASVIYS